jgi:hypothetical protein
MPEVGLMELMASITSPALSILSEGSLTIVPLHMSDRSPTMMPIAWKNGTAASIGLRSARKGLDDCSNPSSDFSEACACVVLSPATVKWIGFGRPGMDVSTQEIFEGYNYIPVEPDV